MQTILITGANKGIGLELVKQYAEAGWRSFACCRLPAEANELQKLHLHYPDLIRIYPLDVKDNKSINTLKTFIQNTPIDILINNAGIWGPAEQAFGSIQSEAWLEAFKTNTIAPLLLAEVFIHNILQGKIKTIVNISSNMGSIELNHSGNDYIYRSTKAALNMVTKTMAMDLKTQGITAVAIHPGWVKTDMGGSHALLSPAESVQGIKKVLDKLTLSDSGNFIDYQGNLLPW